MMSAAATTTKILILEDDPDASTAMKVALVRAGFDVDCTATVGAALVKLELGLRPAAAIIDLRLPDGSGGLVLWKVRRWSRETAVAVVTGVPDPQSHPDLVKEPPDKLFTKPIDLADLVAWLKSVT